MMARPVLYLVCLIVLLAPVHAEVHGPGNAGSPAAAPAPSSIGQGSNGLLPVLVAYLGHHLHGAKGGGFVAEIDRIRLQFTQVEGGYTMEPLGIPEQKPDDWEAPRFTITETTASMDAGLYEVTWRFDRLLQIPDDWSVASLRGRGPFKESTFEISRTEGIVTVRMSSPGSRPELVRFRPLRAE